MSLLIYEGFRFSGATLCQYAALSFGIEQGTAFRHLRQAGKAQRLGEKIINQQSHLLAS